MCVLPPRAYGYTLLLDSGVLYSNCVREAQPILIEAHTYVQLAFGYSGLCRPTIDSQVILL